MGWEKSAALGSPRGLQNPISLGKAQISRTVANPRSPELWREMSHSEKNEPTRLIRSPKLKSEIAAKVGLIAHNSAQRIDDCGQAGGGRGTGIEPSPGPKN